MIVKVIRTKNSSTLVEWQELGRIRRGYVPDIAVEGGNFVPDAVLSLAIPHGEAWDDFIPGDAADALRRAGIWTKSDLKANASIALGVLKQYSLSLSNFNSQMEAQL